jgi:hypothetical protein
MATNFERELGLDLDSARVFRGLMNSLIFVGYDDDGEPVYGYNGPHHDVETYLRGNMPGHYNDLGGYYLDDGWDVLEWDYPPETTLEEDMADYHDAMADLHASGVEADDGPWPLAKPNRGAIKAKRRKLKATRYGGARRAEFLSNRWKYDPDYDKYGRHLPPCLLTELRLLAEERYAEVTLQMEDDDAVDLLMGKTFFHHGGIESDYVYEECAWV